jgi:hypothetical protein
MTHPLWRGRGCRSATTATFITYPLIWFLARESLRGELKYRHHAEENLCKAERGSTVPSRVASSKEPGTRRSREPSRPAG